MKQQTVYLIIALVIISSTIFIIEKSKVNPDQYTVEVSNMSDRVKAKEGKYRQAIELVKPDGYINTDNITVQQFIGNKVVLIDFWTYSCINCQRTLPYLKAWYSKYKDYGLQIIGVHTPEFAFEKVYSNVLSQVKRFGILYPVVLDNSYRTWNAYKNQYWPRKYLIDVDGFIVYDHIGEGGYQETETEIQKLLEERKQVLGLNITIPKGYVTPDTQTPDFVDIKTPEIYMGYGFSRQQFGNSQGWVPDKTIDYSAPAGISRNKFYLDGSWKNNNDNMELAGDTGSILLKYQSKQINIVAGSDNPVHVQVYIDGKFIKNVTISGQTLYTLYDAPDYEERTLELKARKGLMAYTFTFG